MDLRRLYPMYHVSRNCWLSYLMRSVSKASGVYLFKSRRGVR
jgi:hypothetical protein